MNSPSKAELVIAKEAIWKNES